jgi:hypothetical protein
MMFLFAYLGSLSTPPGWPVKLMYVTEAALIIAPVACVLLACKGVGTRLKRDMVAIVGGVSASFGLIMPFELAPFFFEARGEIMLGTVALNLAYPVAAVFFVFLFRKLINVTRENTAR